MQPMINTLLDPIVNFGKVTVSTGYTSTDTTITLTTGDGSKLPNPVPSGSFNLVWFNNSTYSDPADDPYVEIVRCIARVGDTLTLMRAQEGTGVTPNLTGYAHDTVGKIYKMVLSPTKKTIDDIQTESQSKVDTHSLLSTGIHGIGTDTIDGVGARNIAISVHSSATSSVHGFDASGNAPAQTHGISRHTGIIGTWANIDKSAGTDYVAKEVVNIYLGAEAAYLPATNPAVFNEVAGVTTYAGWSYLAFDDTTQQYAVWRVPVPDYNDGNIIVTAYSKPAITPGGNVTLQYNIYTIGISTGEEYNQASISDTGVNISHVLNTGTHEHHVSIASATIDPANVTADDILVISLGRDVASDDLVGNGHLLGIMIEYTKV